MDRIERKGRGKGEGSVKGRGWKGGDGVGERRRGDIKMSFYFLWRERAHGGRGDKTKGKEREGEERRGEREALAGWWAGQLVRGHVWY